MCQGASVSNCRTKENRHQGDCDAAQELPLIAIDRDEHGGSVAHHPTAWRKEVVLMQSCHRQRQCGVVPWNKHHAKRKCGEQIALTLVEAMKSVIHKASRRCVLGTQSGQTRNKDVGQSGRGLPAEPAGRRCSVRGDEHGGSVAHHPTAWRKGMVRVQSCHRQGRARQGLQCQLRIDAGATIGGNVTGQPVPQCGGLHVGDMNTSSAAKKYVPWEDQ